MKKIFTFLLATLGLTSACGQQNFENTDVQGFANPDFQNFVNARVFQAAVSQLSSQRT